MIPNKLLIPETLIITPKSLLLNALKFKASIIDKINQDNDIKFSYSNPYFPKRSYMYIKASEDLALSQKLEIEYGMKCAQCKFNQFPDKMEAPFPASVAESSKQKFVPFYIPTMKIWHKYCFTLSLNRKPITEIGVTFELCDAIITEPREVTFSKKKDLNESMHQRFCITPTEETECILKFFLTGQSIHEYIKPDPIKIYAKESEKPLQIRLPTIIELRNRIISAPQTLFFERRQGEYLDIILIPISKTDNEFFKFEPSFFKIQSDIMQSQEIEFYVTSNVDCPMKDDISNISLYYIIDWKINGSLGNYMKPTPIYIKVIENMDELNPSQEWCDIDDIDCRDPRVGQTCIIDPCILNSSHTDCQPLYAKIKEKQSGLIWWQWLMIVIVIIVLLIIFLKFCGCFDKKEKEEEELESDEEIEEKKIFNTKENFNEAQIAIEKLLEQIYKHEQNLDLNKKYEKDVMIKNYYHD